MGLDGNGILSVVQLVYWTPATALAVAVCCRHGLRESFGAWMILPIVGSLRIAGAACNIAEESMATLDVGLVIADLILASFGLSFLLVMLAGLLKKIPLHLHGGKQVVKRAATALRLVVIAGIALSSVGASDLANYNTPSDVSEGRTLYRAGIAVLAAVYVLLAAALAVYGARRDRQTDAQPRLFDAVAASHGVLLVRLVYSLLVAFADDAAFNLYEPNAWAKGFLFALPEFVIAAIIIWAGFTTPRTFEESDEGAAEMKSSQGLGRNEAYAGV